MPGNEPPPSRIAIKFGAAKPSSRPPPTSTLGKRPRSQLLHADSDSDGEDNDRSSTRHETITTIGRDGDDSRSGAKNRSSKEPLTIPRQANRDWKSEANAKRSRTATPSRRAVDKDVEPADQDKQLKWGLTLKDRSKDATPVSEEPQAGAPETEVKEKAPKTADEEAMDALLDMRDDSKKKELVIARAPSSGVNEDEAFKRTFRDAPDVSTLEEYEEMPVEEFGAALLRGMGWDGKHRGAKTKDVKRRPNQMGLGAKSLKGEEDLGAWNQKGGSRNRPPRLNDYKREERERRDSRDRRRDGGSESYKQERDRERDRDRHGDRSRDHRYRSR